MPRTTPRSKSCRSSGRQQALAASLLLSLTASLLLAGCATPPPETLPETLLSGETMGSAWTVKIAGDLPFPAAELQPGAQAQFEAVNQALSTYRADSALSRFNASDSRDWVEVDPELAAVLRYALTLAERSGGAYDVTVGPHAVVEAEAVIGEGAVLMANAYVGHRSRVGDRCTLYPNVVIREECEVGRRVILHPGVVIGADGFGYVREGRTYHKVPQVGIVVVEDDVEIGANSCVDRATTGITRVGAGTKIDNLVQVGHNVTLGPSVIVVAQVGISGSTEIAVRLPNARRVGWSTANCHSRPFVTTSPHCSAPAETLAHRCG